VEIITVDTETYYDKDFSLSKITMEHYIRDPRFEVIMLGIRWPDGTKEIVTGSHEEVQYRLDGIEWGKYAVLAHNTLFDAAILAWRFGVNPAVWLDTLSMARAMFGMKGNSLALLAKRYGLEDKGTAVQNAMGKRRCDFTEQEFKDYADYCLHDVQLCHELFFLMSNGWYKPETFDHRDPYPRKELELIDRLIRMYTEPTLRLNVQKLEEHLADVVRRKDELLSNAGIAKEDLMSNPKFALVLESFGVSPPMKISATTGKQAFAFAKTDPGMKALLEHPDDRVQAVVAARMGVKSTLEETRTQRFINMAQRNPLFPVPLRYSAARTHRLGGTDGINLQNLPARGAQANKLKKCIEAPPGHVIIDCDSSNIEARMLAWLAGQDDLVQDFANGVDVYCKMASKIFGRPITKADKVERFVGKTVVLGCGYQTGAVKLQITLKASEMNMDLELSECKNIIDTYRNSVPAITRLWRTGDTAIEAMHRNTSMWFGREGVALVEGNKGIKLPSGLYISYPQLHRGLKPSSGNARMAMEVWQYKDETGLVDIYGGKLVENCLAAGTLVLTNRGWVAIEAVRAEDLVHDGIEFVTHGGTVFKSVQTCVSIDGVLMTPDHEVLTNGGWIPASQNPEPYRPDLRHVDGVEPRAQRWEEAELALPVSVRDAMCQSGGRCAQGDQAGRHPQLWMLDKTADLASPYDPRDEQASGVRRLAQYVRSVSATLASGMEQLRRARDNSLRTVADFRELLVRYGSDVCSRFGFGSDRQRWAVFSGELSVDRQANEYYEQTEHYPRGRHTQTFGRHWDLPKHDLLQTETRLDSRPTADNPELFKPVYDILNAGPRQRFVVLGERGPFIVHNCVQALARIVVMQQLLRISKKLHVVLTVHDAVAAIAREEEAEQAQAYVEECMRWVPKWAVGCPINCESGIGKTYGDC
jgi:DNA polymerase